MITDDEFSGCAYGHDQEIRALKAEVERLTSRLDAYEMSRDEGIALAESYKRERDAWKSRAEKLAEAFMNLTCPHWWGENKSCDTCEVCIAQADYRASLRSDEEEK